VVWYCFFYFFFFSSRRRHTRCLSDWSSDVCSSDLLAIVEVLKRFPDSRAPFLARHLRSRRPDRFPTDASAAEALEHPLTRGACLVGIGAADVMVGGAMYPSADTIHAALWAVGMAPSIATVSGAF